MKIPKCKVCKGEYEKTISSMQKVCSPGCALALNELNKSKVKAKDEKAFKAETRRLKAMIKPRGKWLAEAQQAFNKWVRLSQADQPCISCGQSTGCKVNAGHYLSVGAHPELRFNEDNVHLQCEKCNCFLSGNQVKYRARLIDKIGIERVEKLEGPQPKVKLTIEDIKAIKEDYKARVKGLENETS